MKLVDGITNNFFVMLQFEPNNAEKESLSKALGYPIKDFEKTWLNIGQFRCDKEMLNCIQVGTDAWGSNCDMTLDEFTSDFQSNVQNFLTKMLNSDITEMRSKVGTEIELKVA